jgi:iron complex transport system permease protein
MPNDSSFAIKSEYKKFGKRRLLFISASTVLLIFAFFISLTIGSYQIDISNLFKSILSPIGLSGGASVDLIMWENRIPRAIIAILAGAGLALGGIVTQTSTRNPLASPFTLGISSAASFGASLVIVFGGGALYASALNSFNVTTYTSVFLGAFICSLTAVFCVFAIMKFRTTRPDAIVLAGIAINFLFSAATSCVQYFGNSDQVAAAIFWSFGSLSKVTWSSFWVMSVSFTSVFILLYYWCWKFNALYMGDEVAKSLGVDADKMRVRSIILAAMITAIIVSFLGVISFICLVAPHIARLVVGGDHRYLIPASCLTGASILLIADIASRTIFSPVIIPVGILTSFLGVPLFLFLLMRKKEYW